MVLWLPIAALLVLIGLALSARFTFWRPNLPGVPILMYHYLTDDLDGTGIPSLRVRPSAFEKQVIFFKEKGYTGLSLNEFYRCLSGESPWPDKAVIITFDDGSRHCLTAARDILSRYGFTATVFIVTDQIGGTNAWDHQKYEPVVKLLDWDEIKELIEAGWEVGSHTRTHPDLTGLSDEALDEELTGSREVLEERLGVKITSLAYPYGFCDERVKQAAARAGYRLGISTRHGKNTRQDDPFELKRIIIKRRDNRLDLILKLKKGRSTL